MRVLPRQVPFWLSSVCLLLSDCAIPGESIAERERTRQHAAWMEACSSGPVEFRRSADLDIYSADVSRGDPDAVVSCLLSSEPGVHEIVGRGPGLFATLFATQFYSVYDPERKEKHPAPAALVRSGTKVHVLQADADHGIVNLQHAAGDAFVVSSGFVTHVRNALFTSTTGRATRLTNGAITVEDREALLFRVTGAKSFWRPRGAFWYDAVIDSHNRILDIVTPPTGACLSPREFTTVSGLDLALVTSRRVCVQGTAPPIPPD